MRGGGNGRRGGIAHVLAAPVVLATVVACGDLQQAGTGSGGAGTDDSTGAAGSDAPASTGVESSDDGDGDGTGDGATLDLDTGPGEESTTSAALDDTGSTGDPGDGSSSGGDDGPPAGPHDGAYEGTFSAQFQVEDQVGACMGPVVLTVDENAATQVTGTGTCSVTIDFFTFDIVATIEGTVASPNASGTLSANINGTAESTTWNGTFAVDTMDATFAGDFPQGPYTVTYVGTWQATR